MLELFAQSLNNLKEKLGGWLDTLILSLPNLVLAIAVLVIAYFASRYLRKNIKRLMKRFSTDQSINNLVASFGAMLIFVVALFIALGILNLNQALTSLLATAGVAGLAVGLALQDPLINMFSGISMSMRHYYNIGDWVATNGFEGRITRINLRTTELLKPSGEKIIIPNKSIVKNPFENLSVAGRRRVAVECGVGYSSDLPEVKRIARQAIADTFDYVDDPAEVEFFFTGFGGSSIDFVARFWIQTKSLIEFKAAKSEAIVAIKQAFDEADINIPFPIRTLDFGMNELSMAGKNGHAEVAQTEPSNTPMSKN